MDESSVSGIADLVRVVRNGNFVGVIAQSEWGAIQAARQLNVAWNNASVLPDQNQLGDCLRQQPTSDKQIVNNGDVDTALSNADQVIQASYNHPYQDHAQLLGMPADSVHVIHMECAFSGCARTSTSGSRTVRRWRSTCAARLTARAANNRVTVHWLSDSPIRVSALRSLGAMANTFANESFMDELAYAAGLDPLQFRLNHLDDPRAIAVLQAAADKIGWQAHTAPSGTGRGMGMAFARYENNEAYVATAADVSVDASSGRITLNRIAVAHDCGLIINPELPAYGAGEITTLTPPPAIANAIFHATGQRMRSVPLL